MDIIKAFFSFVCDNSTAGSNLAGSYVRALRYATEMLRQVCNIAKENGLAEMKLSVEKSNIPSIHTIKKNGGVYSYSFIFENEEADVYKIKLKVE